MPNIESAAKRMRQAAKNLIRNRKVNSEILGLKRKFNDAVESGNKSAAMELFRKFCAKLDQSAKKGVIKANNASRRKSRAAARLAKMSAK
jgi:small subunit ribosomal protein S20